MKFIYNLLKIGNNNDIFAFSKKEESNIDNKKYNLKIHVSTLKYLEQEKKECLSTLN